MTVRRVLLAVQVLLALLVMKRLIYHAVYLRDVPFAVLPVLDGRVYEAGARDLLRHPPFGSAAMELDGLYAYVMALPMSVLPWLAFAMLFQLALAAAAWTLFARAAATAFGRLPGAIATALLLAYPALAYFENKWGAEWLRAALSAAVLWAFARATRRAGGGRLALLGALSAAAVLSNPWTLLALPFTALSVRELARAHASRTARLLAAFALGFALPLAAAGARNYHVLGSAELLPRHAISLPLFIGNNSQATGRWNDAGDLVERAKGGGRAALVSGLGLERTDARRLDAEIDRILYARTLAFVAAEPASALRLAARKVWYSLGDREVASGYEMAGERELLGSAHHVGVPFAVLAALGFAGIVALLRAPRAPSAEHARPRGTGWLLMGQLVGPGAMLVLGYASAEHRVPVAVPLCFAAGPALFAICAGLRQRTALALRRPELVVAAALCLQAFVPRSGAAAPPSAWHYFHLASVEERLGNIDAAIMAFDRAIALDPREPVFLLSQARMLRLVFEIDWAERVLSRLDALPNVPARMRSEAYGERALLERLKRWRTAQRAER